MEQFSEVRGITSQNARLQGVLLQFNRFGAAFELCVPSEVVRVSEVIRSFELQVRKELLYSGRAIVRSLVRTGSSLICEVGLDDAGWQNRGLAADAVANLGDDFAAWLKAWQGACQVRSEYKVIIADMQTFLADLRLWCQQVELGLQAARDGRSVSFSGDAAASIAEAVVPCINVLFEKFECFTGTLPGEVLPAHWAYMRRQLHPLVLCGPFPYRTFVKPLGYAGDYEMVNMIVRNGWEGDSLFAKVVNTWFLRQPPACAHRNRIAYLADRLCDETLRVHRLGRVARILSLACGPAHEAQRFLTESAVSDYADIALLDFDPETIRHVTERLRAIKRERHRQTALRFILKSVQELLREQGRLNRHGRMDRYDLIYCAGLFDYLPDHVCGRLLGLMYELAAPGGLLVATNVEPSNPLRNGMEHLLDWHLIHRTAAQMADLCPPEIDPGQTRVFTEETGTNVFMEIRKPADARI